MNEKDFAWVKDGDLDFILTMCNMPVAKVEHFILYAAEHRYCGVFADGSETDGFVNSCTAKRHVEKRFGLKITPPYHKGKK